MSPWVHEGTPAEAVLESSGLVESQECVGAKLDSKSSRLGDALPGNPFSGAELPDVVLPDVILNESEQTSVPAESEFFQEMKEAPGGKRRAPAWLWVSPFFLSALLFLSAVFTVIAPLPILFLGFKKGRPWVWLAAFTNSLLVWLVAGTPSLITYLIFVAVLAVTCFELLQRRRSVEFAAFFTLVAMALTAWIGVNVYAKVEKTHPVAEIRSEISEFVDYFGQGGGAGKGSSSSASNAQFRSETAMDPADLEEWKQSLIIELPSAIAVIGLILVWVNLTLLIRINPGRFSERLGIPPGFLQDWKAPEFLVWPTILSGATLLVDLGPATDVGRNVFKFLMAIYAIQGLSILSFFFNHWKLRRIFRFVGYLVAILVMTPLLLSLGFFDLWFDFRGKFRQS